MADIEQQLTELQQQEAALVQQKSELEKAKTETADYEAKKVALEKEHERILKAIDADRIQKNSSDKSFAEKLRQENLAKARQKFIVEHGYQDKPDALKSLDETFKKFDSGSMTAENIEDDFFAAHIKLNTSKYKEMENTVQTLKKQADEYTKSASGSAFDGAGSPPIEEVQLTPEDLQAARWANIPLEKFRELKAKGKI